MVELCSYLADRKSGVVNLHLRLRAPVLYPTRRRATAVFYQVGSLDNERGASTLLDTASVPVRNEGFSQAVDPATTDD